MDTIKTSQIKPSQRMDTLSYEGKDYVKIMAVPQTFKYVTDAGKTNTKLWLCAEVDTKFPAKLILVPEFNV